MVSALDSLIWSSSVVAVARFSADGSLKVANPRFASLIGDRAGKTGLPELVVQGQRDDMVALLRGCDAADTPRHLHFARGEDPPITLIVRWEWEDGDLLMVGEAPLDDLETSQALLVKLNSRVSDLARENVKKSAQLEKALADLRQAQALLVHREKMAALGQMTAGVAHELNNPLAYVKNNQYLLARGLTDLLELINLFGETLEDLEKTQPIPFATIMDKVREIDLPHLSESIPKLLHSLDGGVDRAADLVRQLRTFSRLDEAEFKTVDLNESLRAVVDMAGFLMRENGTRFSADYGELPPITCSPGQVNQAVHNILANAIQAAGRGGKVRLATQEAAERVAITISDDGPGIPEELKDRVFEPFYTSKAVGQGTGLGLSIAHAVIAQHGGSIEVGGEPGGGAIFTVMLPLNPAAWSLGRSRSRGVLE